ncbi:MAG: S-methyl-5-thioribose-1-phosphate isomerase [Rhodospirillales bacterium]|nr:S-methyl-5-thioribose-1-phosphate isomerase [Rhodospirillales bacterium]|tara:strand:+ start:1773 stop:2822 length:1050 start_codon:yes stop_codon:yes gene_type:complete
MLVNGRNYKSIWREEDSGAVKIIDQRWLPHKFSIVNITSCQETMTAIRDMWVRGAPLIGVTAAYGMAMAMQEDASDENLISAGKFLNSARPTAINLAWAVERMQENLKGTSEEMRAGASLELADLMAEEDIEINRRIGEHGAKIIEDIFLRKSNGDPVRILTHCNAGWLATVDRGTATAPIYEASENKVPIEVWVDETRPRNQGAALTTWELMHNQIPHTLIVDNAGGHLMQRGLVDLCIVGSDRTTSTGDVCNKIGTYLKALAAKDNNIPFYVALPSSTIDENLNDGISEIPIENRGPHEVTHIQGKKENGELIDVQICPDGVEASNPAFDVTPKRLVTGLITENGIK